MAQHEHDHAGNDETDARKGAAEAAAPSDGETRSEDEAIFRPVEEKAEPGLSEGDREREASGNPSDQQESQRESAAGAAEPELVPRKRKRHRQTLTLVFATLGLAATLATVAAFHFRDKNEKLRAFSAFVENAFTRPEKLAPKRPGGAGETDNSSRPAETGTAAPPHDVRATPPNQGQANETPRGLGERGGRPEPEAAPPSRGASGKPAEVDHAEALGKRIDELERIARSALAAAEEARSSADKAPGAERSAPAPSSEQGSYLNALEGRIDELDSQIRALREKLEASKGETRLPRDQADVGGAAADRNGGAAIVVVTQSLVQALDRGRPYASEYAALAALAVDPGQLAVLEPFAKSGAPTARQLLASFAPVAKDLRAIDARPDAPYADRLMKGVGRWVKIRPAGAPATDSISDIVAYIEAALSRGEIAAAADAFARLPENAANEAREWGETIRNRVDAEKAADSILSSAIGALGRTKS